MGEINGRFSVSQVLADRERMIGGPGQLSQLDSGASRQCEPRQGWEPAGRWKRGDLEALIAVQSAPCPARFGLRAK